MTRLLTAIALAAIFYSCRSVTGSGKIETRTRHTDQFTGVKTSGSIDIEIAVENKQEVKIDADDNIMEYVITNVENGLLNVHLRSNVIYHDTHVKVYVSTPSLNRLYTSGAASITSPGTLYNDKQIKVDASGSSDIDAIVDAPSISIDASGASTIKLKGRTKDVTCSASGSANIKAKELLSENADVSVSGSGSAHVFASVHLKAKASGSGDVFYGGNPSNPSIHTSGAGSVREEK